MSDSQRAAADAINANITTGITGVPKIVYEAPDVVIDEERNSEGETDSLRDELNVHNIERERTVVVETMEEEEELDNSVNRRYPNQQIHTTTRYEPKLQGKRYEDDAGAMLLNYGDTLGSTNTEDGEIEQVLGIIIDQ